MLVPEIVILKAVNAFIAYVKEDYNTTTDKTETVLHDLFNEDDNGDRIAFEAKDSLYRSAVKLLTKDNEEVDNVVVNIGFNRERSELGTTTIHILLPTENKGSMDTLTDNEHYTTDGNFVFVHKNRSKRAVYHLMITSKNVEEVLVMYYFIQAVFLIFNHHVELQGMRNLRMSGADINVQAEYPTVAYYRNCTIEFEYEYEIKTRLRKEVIEAVNFSVCANFVNDQINGIQ